MFHVPRHWTPEGNPPWTPTPSSTALASPSRSPACRESSSGCSSPLLTLLAAGEPVTVDQFAAEADRPVEEIRRVPAALPDTEYDTEGRVIGHGLTRNPTPHRYEAGGRTLYAWCALDTLAFPAILGHTAQVTSACRATGQPVRLTVTPDGPTSVEPATAVVSLVTPDTPTSIRTSFCNQIHFFAAAEAAGDWLAEHPEARVLPVADAFEAERDLNAQIISGGRCPQGGRRPAARRCPRGPSGCC
jgi:alkylmercury lyase